MTTVKAACMNAVRNPEPRQPTIIFDGLDLHGPYEAWIHCGWIGEVADLTTDPCPRCLQVGTLAPRVDIEAA